MTVLVTGSSGHLGEALMRTLRASGRAVLGLDIIPGPFTDAIGSIADRDLVARSLQGVDAVLHSATLHKPHVATHAREAFVETNVRGTLILLEAAAHALCPRLRHDLDDKHIRRCAETARRVSRQRGSMSASRRSRRTFTA